MGRRRRPRLECGGDKGTRSGRSTRVGAGRLSRRSPGEDAGSWQMSFQPLRGLRASPESRTLTGSRRRWHQAPSQIWRRDPHEARADHELAGAGPRASVWRDAALLEQDLEKWQDTSTP